MNSGGDGRYHHTSHGSTSSAGSTVPPPPPFPVSTPTPTPTLPDYGVTTPSAASTPASVSAGQRKERGAIAAQACDTCRSRKQKCDEQRPKCGTCQKFKLDCHYREPQPTKKDKTLGDILERLKTMETKIDVLGLRGTLGPALYPGSEVPKGDGSASDLLLDRTAPRTTASTTTLGPDTTTNYTYRYSPAVYQMLGWPVVQQLLAPLAPRLPQLKTLAAEQEALGVVLGLHHPKHQLPSDTTTVLSGMTNMPGQVGQPLRRDSGGSIATPAGFYPSTPVSLTSSLALPLGTPLAKAPPPPLLLSWDILYRLSNAYFDSFNYVAPIVDRQTFLTVTLPAALEVNDSDGNNSAADSGGGDPSTTLVFLVAALGDVAIAGVQGAPVLNVYRGNGRSSSAKGGVKGGTVRHPPGLAFFNEARKRMGFALSDCSLENMQTYALAGIYCSTCLRHMEYWRYTTTASLSCQALITSKPSELRSPRADLIRQIFWYCLIVETHFNIELGLPLTGLDRFEDLVGLPAFSGPYSQDDYLANQASHFQEHYASQIVLRRLCVAFHNTLSFANGSGATLEQDRGAATSTGTAKTATNISGFDSISLRTATTGSPFSFPDTIAQMALQLEGWRGMLPPHLRWQESRPADFPNAAATEDPDEDMFGGNNGNGPSFFTSTKSSSTSSTSAPLTDSATSGPSSSTSTSFAAPATMFSADLDATPVAYPFALDLQVALLRSRYYYCKYLVYKPCLYKAMHHPDQLSHDDATGAAACLQACLSWPVAMSPTCAHKRLIPCLFFYTQNFLGVLVVLRLAQQLPILQRIKATLCGGERFERAARETTALCLAWMRDLRGVDRAAEWAWAIVKGLYHLEE